MAAAMDVDEENMQIATDKSGGGRKRFEVKKVRLT